ncbi:hypothetical protein XELAEV_18012417mg [Xenopus laevis]|uniref:Uncharacterized protein n=1 Tax=Xenopus laevis TaxID=8355 RepID=A0A974HYN9_XENLA|nr:hypothetical protein XELAEV_18012417mg [Xenopus laevis]
MEMETVGAHFRAFNCLNTGGFKQKQNYTGYLTSDTFRSDARKRRRRVGCSESKSTSRTERTLLTFLLFHAKRAIKWKDENPPTLSYWIALVEQTLPTLEQIYYARGCPTKFNKIWTLWLLRNESYTNRTANIPDQPLDWLEAPIQALAD